MNAAPRVSVILPTYNRAATLPRAIASVLNQSFRDLELIVVDDGSEDATAEVVAGFHDSRLVYLASAGNSGDAGARNRGIAVARGEWLAFQDSDDEWLAHKLDVQLGFADTLPAKIAVVGASLLRIHGRGVMRYGWPLRSDAPPSGGLVDGARWVADGIAFLQTILMRRAAVIRLGGFEPSLKACSDAELCFRLIREQPFAAVRDVVAVLHETPGSLALDPDYRRCALRFLLARHGDLIQASRRSHSHYLYELAQAEMLCGDLPESRRLVRHALRLRPGFWRGWAYWGAALLGREPLQRLRAWNQARRPT